MIVIATVSTAHFHFMAVAPTAAEVDTALLAAWTRHVDQTGADPDLMVTMLEDEDVNYHFMADMPAVFRDGSPL